MGEQQGPGSPTVPVKGKALCRFGDGTTRTLYATDISLTRAFIVSVRPPPVRTPVVVTFCGLAGGELPPIPARVVSTRLDPTDVAGSGFGLLFNELTDDVAMALRQALPAFGLPGQDAQVPQAAERREHPRVLPSRELKAKVKTPDGTITTTVSNLSLSGALLAYDSPDDTEELAVGTQVPIHVIDQHGVAVAALDARVVRLTHSAEPKGAGVVFVDADEPTLTRIENLILNVLGDIDEPFAE